MKERNHYAFILILFLFCLYAAVYIYRTSFVIDNQRYFSLFDDAMVSMRYADNFAHGYGLVWNRGGERVEGYTNLFWVLFMAVFHLFNIAKSKMSLCIQASGAIFLLFNLLFIKMIADRIFNHSRAVSLFATLLTAFYLPLNTWSLQGMEVSALTLLTTMAVWHVLISLDRGKFPLTAYLLLGLSTLLRIDMYVLYAAILIFLSIVDIRHRREHLRYGIILGLCLMALQTGFRFWYYGEWLPNTYYLKITGYPALLRMLRGAIVFGNFVFRANAALFLLPFILLIFRRDRYSLLLFGIFLAQVMYSVYVGGDAWESWGGSNRFISIVMPLFFILFSHAWVFAGKIVQNRLGPAMRSLFPYAATIFVIIALLSFNSLNGSTTLREWALVSAPLHVSDNKKMVRMGLLLNRITDDKTSIAVVWAGAIPYFSERQSIDLLGKSDKHVARLLMRFIPDRLPSNNFHPGHLKWDYSYSIGQLQPDIITRLWYYPDEAKPYLDTCYQSLRVEDLHFWIRNDRLALLKKPT